MALENNARRSAGKGDSVAGRGPMAEKSERTGNHRGKGVAKERKESKPSFLILIDRESPF
ncbi:hypothetical protein Q0590_26360 [Rhodocytophaga aerolata]|uniref:Uncharacterized protein n=1 Tax=Rhodocytophaga aerolata TaxID=455078 RepID=A0ABT8RGA4_9BACT|nr:hypothetical protein [Rhodocytophaga aerolata]MDO1449830.1 hypothetical protein [Rhodocytophaga aerolata]